MRTATAARADVAAWVWGIAVRTLVSRLRTRRVPAVPVRERDDVVVSAEDLVLLGVEHGDVGAALGRLAPELRAVVQATVLDGLTNREAARLLGLPQRVVRTRRRTALARLRGELAPARTGVVW